MFDYHRWLNLFPGTNFHELNIDWLVEAVKHLAREMYDFEIVNQITYEGPFDITKQYKAWAIVTDNNIGYISKQPVPAGVQLNNTEYWEVVADFTALIGDLGTRVIALESDVNDLNEIVLDKPRKIIYCGDSYGRGLSIIGGQTVYGNGWTYYADQRLRPAMSYNLSTNQAAFAPGNPSNLRYGYQLEQFVLNHTAAECEAITDIIIAGGFNESYFPNDDLVDSATQYCATWTASYIKEHFPYAKVFIGMIGRVPRMSGLSNALFVNFNRAIDKYKQIAIKNHWKYLTNVEFAGHDYSTLSEDGVHYTTQGYELIGYAVATAVNDGSWVPGARDGKALTLVPYATSSNTKIKLDADQLPSLYNQFTDSGISVFNTGAMNCIFDAPQSVDFTQTVKICKYFDTSAHAFNMFTPLYRMYFNCFFDAYNSGTMIGRYPGMIAFNDTGDIELIAKTDLTGAQTFDAISIYFDQHTLPFSMC